MEDREKLILNNMITGINHTMDYITAKDEKNQAQQSDWSWTHSIVGCMDLYRCFNDNRLRW